LFERPLSLFSAYTEPQLTRQEAHEEVGRDEGVAVVVVVGEAQTKGLPLQMQGGILS
jgi:hypothetical protein